MTMSYSYKPVFLLAMLDNMDMIVRNWRTLRLISPGFMKRGGRKTYLQRKNSVFLQTASILPRMWSS